MAEKVGVVIGDRYQLVELVGQGGMGRVWRGHDQTLDREVAVKEVVLPSAELGEQERATVIERAKREARAAARLHHAGIVTVHDVAEHGGLPWLVMEFVHGSSLGELITREGRLDWRQAALHCAQVADALAHAHAAGVIHRDLKPDNVLLADGRAVITDFGVARILDVSTRLTSTRTVVGTPQYMSPEQLDGKLVAAASDMWALGATLYAAVDGHPPFDGETLMSIITAVLTHPLPPASHAGPLTDLLSALLDKESEHRPDATTTAKRLRELALDTVEATTIPVTRPSRPTPGHTLFLVPGSDQFPKSTATPPEASWSHASRRVFLVGGLGAAAGIVISAVGAAAFAAIFRGRPVPAPAERHNAGDRISSTLGGTGLGYSLAFSPDGKTLAGGGNGIGLWQIVGNTAAANNIAFQAASGIVTVAFSPDGKLLASGGGDNNVGLWDISDNSSIATLTGHSGTVRSVAFSPDGKTIASGSDDRSIRLWDVANRSSIATLTGPPGEVFSVAFSPDGKTLASGTNADNSVRLWNVANRSSITTPPGNAGQVLSVAFSPDGKTLAYGTGGLDVGNSNENSVRLWDVASRSSIATLTGHINRVNSVKFSPDGRTIASGSDDSSVRLWDVANRSSIATLTGPPGEVFSVTFSPDGKTIASGKGDVTQLWTS